MMHLHCRLGIAQIVCDVDPFRRFPYDEVPLGERRGRVPVLRLDVGDDGIYLVQEEPESGHPPLRVGHYGIESSDYVSEVFLASGSSSARFVALRPVLPLRFQVVQRDLRLDAAAVSNAVLLLRYFFARSLLSIAFSNAFAVCFVKCCLSLLNAICRASF